MIRSKCLLFIMMFSLMVISQQAWAEIFVASYDNSSIRVFDNQDTANVAPKRVIEGGNTGLSNPTGVYVDGGEIFVSNYGNQTITVYKETDSGNVAPQRTITGVTKPINLTVAGGELFVADNVTSAIYVFNKTDSGASAPKRTIKNPTVLLDAYGVVVSQGEIFVSQQHGSGEPPDNVVVFNVSDDGTNVSPKRTIAGANTGFANPYGIDVAGGEIFVFNDDGSYVADVRVFPTSADGNVAPSRVIAVGSPIELVNGVVVAGEVFASNYTDSAVYVFNADGSGTVPKRAIEGGNTGIDYPYDVFVSLPAVTLATGNPSSYKVTVTRVEMWNGTSWVTIFSGTAQLEIVTGGTFLGISDLSLPAGTYTQVRVTFNNSFPVAGTLDYCGNQYTTATTFGGQTNLASKPTDVQGEMAEFTFRIEAWGALDEDVTLTFSITAITVGPTTDYQPTLRFGISNTLLLKGTVSIPSSNYFALSAPMVSIVEP